MIALTTTDITIS